MKPRTNTLLGMLPPEVAAALASGLETVTLSPGEVVAEAGEFVRRILFPLTAIISLVVPLGHGDLIEVAMIGMDGVVGALAGLGVERSLQRAIVQVPGLALALSADRLRTLVARFPELETILLRHEQIVMARAQQTAACNAAHSIEARMCRWLLRMSDLTRSERLAITHESMSQMLGVRRPSVSLAAKSLEQAGIVRYRRGTVTILDTGRLRQSACECYAVINRQYEQVFGRLPAD